MKVITVFTLLLFFLKGCPGDSVNPENATFGKEFIIKPLKTIELNEEVLVTFDAYADSRCPEGVQCIRAGELFVTLKLKNTNSTDEKQVTFCVAGECLIDKSLVQRKVYYSGDTVEVGNENYIVEIQDFSPVNPPQNAQSEAYSMSLIVRNSKL